MAIELVLGFGFAWVMYRIVRGRSFVRTAILVPYGIITVVSAFVWRYAFQLDSGFVNQWFGLSDYNWFGDRWSSLFVITLSEIWKTTPFISLLLLAGLVQVPEELLEAAKVDGATAWQRLWKVVLPNMKAAIMVAVLFRTLDAWRIFDNPFIMTAGANDTETLSFLAYRQNVTLVNLGRRLGDLGAAVLHRRDHRLHLHQGLQDRPVPGEGGRLMDGRKTSNWWTFWGVLILVWAAFPLLWMVSLSFKSPDDVPHRQRRRSSRRTGPGTTSRRSSSDELFTSALRNSFGIAVIATLLSVVVAMFAAYAIARLDFRGKKLLLSMALGHRHVPAGRARRTAVQHVARASASTTPGSG